MHIYAMTEHTHTHTLKTHTSTASHDPPIKQTHAKFQSIQLFLLIPCVSETRTPPPLSNSHCILNP